MYKLTIIAAMAVLLVGCGASHGRCSARGYKGVVLANADSIPERYCSNGNTQGRYYTTIGGEKLIRDYSYFEFKEHNE